MSEENGSAPEEASKITPPESGAPFNEVEDVIFRRRSVRFYQKKQVPEYLVRRVLEAGRFAPSAGNGQTWKFIVVRDPKMIEEMSRDIIDVCRRVKNFADYLEPGKQGRKWRANLLMRFRPGMFHPIPFGAMKFIAEGKLGIWHDAPTVILLLADMRCPGEPAIDIGITGQNMVLTAVSMGLGTCWVSFAKPLNMLPKWKKRLGIKYPYTLFSSLALGYSKGNPDGYVPRETQAIDWFEEDGSFRVVY